MKRILTLVLALLMISALFAGCADSNNPSGSDTTTTAGNTPAPGNPGDTTPTDTTPSGQTQNTTAPKETTEAKTTKDTTTEAPVVVYPVIKEGTMVYFEDFEGYTNIDDSAAVAQLLGWTIRNKADGALTDNTARYAIENGQLKVTNYDGGSITASDCYVEIATTDYMAAACQGDYTVQYDVYYKDVKAHDRYIALIMNYDGYNTYNSFHLRANGAANHQPRFFGTWANFDVYGDYYAGGNDSNTGSSVIYKLSNGQSTYVKGETRLMEKSLTIRWQASYNDGPTVWVRDNSQPGAEFICVSKYDVGATGAAYWNVTEDYAVCLKVGGAIDGYVDNIAIWTGLGEMPTDTTTTDYEMAVKQ